MIDRKCWGIFRETSHSPGREDDDTAILRVTADKLREKGFDVTVCEASAAEEALHTPGSYIFSMCEQHRIIEDLLQAEKAGSIIVNRPGAVLNTYRHHTVEIFTKAKISAPPSRIVAADPRSPAPSFPVWIKRYDFHATQPSDVLFADNAADWTKALTRFAERGIPFVVIQNHVPGDLIKFYGVWNPNIAAPTWFIWFYHRNQKLCRYAFDESLLEKTACTAAGALGVEIFGGDAIVGIDGQPMIIDLNAWPSYAMYRETASDAIAEHLEWRFTQQAASAVG
jgi:hypothetical protein